MRRFLAILAILLPALAFSQVHVHGAQPSAPLMTPDMNMPAGKIYVDVRTIPKKHFGFSGIRVTQNCGPLTSATINSDGTIAQCPTQAPAHLNDHLGIGGGAFRILCGPSHLSFDDPIVKPRQAGMTHLHQFFGNTTTGAQSDAALMASVGNSTCAGGIANRTGYWTPVLIYHCPAIEVGCTRSRDGEIFAAYSNNAYYKTQNFDANNVARITWWPVGFRMISGDPSTVNPANIFPGTRFDCFPADTFTADHIFNTQEATANSCNEINFLVTFPACSTDTLSDLYEATPIGGNHSAHTDGTANCTVTGFTQAHPNITFNVHTMVPNVADWDYLVLSSDQPATSDVVQAGSTTTAIHLPSTEYAINSVYVHGAIMWGGERRYITAYDGVTKIATVSPAFSTAPGTGATVGVRLPAGRSIHGDWANGWSSDPNFNGWGRSVTAQIIRSCYFDTARYGAPSTSGYNLDLDCNDDLLGDPASDAFAEPRVGGTYWTLF